MGRGGDGQQGPVVEWPWWPPWPLGLPVGGNWPEHLRCRQL